ncbi:MAG: hypothetical protein AAFS10_23625, partial [Myxococcota bacterium]
GLLVGGIGGMSAVCVGDLFAWTDGGYTGELPPTVAHNKGAYARVMERAGSRSRRRTSPNTTRRAAHTRDDLDDDIWDDDEDWDDDTRWEEVEAHHRETSAALASQAPTAKTVPSVVSGTSESDASTGDSMSTSDEQTQEETVGAATRSNKT